MDRTERVPPRHRQADGRAGTVRAARSPRSTAVRAPTSSRSASPSRSWPASTRRWRSRSRRGSGWGANPIHGFGTEEQKQRWLVPMCRGEILGAFGLTEPGGGSDAGATRTTARLEGGEWVINGVEGVHHQLRHRHHRPGDDHGRDRRGARTGTRRSRRSSSRPGRPGSRSARSYRKIGWHASDTHELSFDDCRVPEANLLGRARATGSRSSSDLDDGPDRRRALGRRAGPGVPRRVAWKYASERQAFGRPIGGVPGDPVQDRRHEGGRRDGPAWPRTGRRGSATRAGRTRPSRVVAKLYASEIAVTCRP